MKAEELRIGNLALGKHKDWDKFDTISFDRGSKIDLINSSMWDFKPIPLTEEWLIKFGFKRTKNKMVFRAKELSIEVNDYGLVTIWQVTSQWHWTSHNNQVHQLQNLYFALTNEELTIK